MWDYGVFEVWDEIGLDRGIELIEEYGESLASWVSDMKAAGMTSFYKAENGKKHYYDIESKSYQVVPSAENYIKLDYIRGNSPALPPSPLRRVQHTFLWRRAVARHLIHPGSKVPQGLFYSKLQSLEAKVSR